MDRMRRQALRSLRARRPKGREPAGGATYLNRLTAAAAALLAGGSLAGCSQSVGVAVSPAASPPSKTSAAAPSPIQLFYSSKSIDPTAITSGPDGNLWFADAAIPVGVGRVTTTGAIDVVPDPDIQNPRDIVAGPDGALWFANMFGKSGSPGSIGRITVAGSFSHFVNSQVHMPDSITAGPDGNLWFTDGVAVGRLTPRGVLTYFNGAAIDAKDITKGPDGNLWVANGGPNSGSIGRITPSGGATTFKDPGIATPLGITAGPDGNLWFTAATSLVGFHPSIGRITPSGVITLFTNPKLNTPRGIVAGPDGNLWFTDEGSHNIGRITPAGVFSYFPIIGYGRPTDIAIGQDGNVWFTYPSYSIQGGIGRLTISRAG
jgi:streptogramin lyase